MKLTNMYINLWQVIKHPPRLRNLLFAGLLCFLSGTLPGQQLVDGIAAVVEDDYILYSDVEQYAQMQAMQMNVNPYNNPDKYHRLQEQVLQSLIDQKIIQAKAKEDSIVVKDHEVDQALQQQIDNMISRGGRGTGA